MNKATHIPWELVTTSPTLNEIKKDWLSLLGDKSQKEYAYQSFISNHAGMFFPNQAGKELVVLSGMKLGSDHEVDFVLAHSDRSYGYVYNLVEIETPHESIYTKSGNPKARLTHAIQQTSDWKCWLETNHDQMQRLFPSKRSRVNGLTHFEYTVIMGRRDNEFINKRNNLADRYGVSIRSFDWFTDNLFQKRHRSFSALTSNLILPSHEDDNKFTDPFFKALTDSQWRRIVDDPNLKLHHMVAHNLDILFEHMQYNTQRKQSFLDYLGRLPGGIPTPSDQEYKIMSYR